MSTTRNARKYANALERELDTILVADALPVLRRIHAANSATLNKLQRTKYTRMAKIEAQARWLGQLHAALRQLEALPAGATLLQMENRNLAITVSLELRPAQPLRREPRWSR